MNHRYILSAFHPRDFNSFGYGSIFSCPSFLFSQQHYLSKTGVFLWSLMLQKQRGDWSHTSITLQKPLFFIRFDVAQQRHDWSHSRTSLQKLWSFVKLDVSKAKRWLIPQQHYLSKTLFFHLALGFLLWVACFASLHISILNKFNDLQLSSWPMCCFLSDADLMTFPFSIDASQRVSSWNQRGWLVYVMSYLFG